jgi:hypothetical protein
MQNSFGEDSIQVWDNNPLGYQFSRIYLPVLIMNNMGSIA